MPVLRRILLVVHVVQEAGHAPLLLVLAEAARVRPHGGLDGEHVLAQRVALGPPAHKVPGVFPVHDLSHGISLRSIGIRLQVSGYGHGKKRRSRASASPIETTCNLMPETYPL